METSSAPSAPETISEKVVLEAGGIGQIRARGSFRERTVAILAGAILVLICIVTVWVLILASSFRPAPPPNLSDLQSWSAAERAISDAQTERALKIFSEVVLKGLMPAFLALSGFFAGSRARG